MLPLDYASLASSTTSAQCYDYWKTVEKLIQPVYNWRLSTKKNVALHPSKNWVLFYGTQLSNFESLLCSFTAPKTVFKRRNTQTRSGITGRRPVGQQTRINPTTIAPVTHFYPIKNIYRCGLKRIRTNWWTWLCRPLVLLVNVQLPRPFSMPPRSCQHEN